MDNPTNLPLLRRMTFSAMRVVMVLVLMCAVAPAWANGGKVTISLNEVTLDKALSEIEKQTGYRFFYSHDIIDPSVKVTVKAEKEPVASVLDRLLAPHGIGYVIKKDRIALTRTSEKPAGKVPASNAARPASKNVVTVQGTVTDDSGEPLVGVSVVGNNGVGGVITDAVGNYSIDVPVGTQLTFSYVGCTPVAKKIADGNSLNVALVESGATLGEVVVVGYGQQKKSSVVSSISTVKASELTVKTSNLMTGIAGKLSGVIAVQRSGEPGNDGAAFYIRGQSSYAGGTNPLVLVDGIPRSMRDLDVDEIETFTVLKDAAATAVYGAEGANGVVLITTKRGKVQKVQVDVSAQFNIVQPTRMQRFLSSYDYLSLYDEARWNDLGNPTRFTPETSETVLDYYRTGIDPDLYPNTDWTDLLKNQTYSQRYTVSVRGGSERVRYFASGMYYDEDGIFKSNTVDDYNSNIGLQRFNLRSNIDMDLTSTTLLSLDMSGQYMRRNNPGVGTDEIFSAINRFPVHVIPMIYSDGTFSDIQTGGFGLDNQPYNMLNNSGYIKTWGAYLQTKLTIDQKLDFITQGLSVKGIVSFDADFASSMQRSKTPETYSALRREGDELIYQQVKHGTALTNPWNSGTSGQKKIYLEASLNYNRKFSSVHDVTGLVLYMQKENQYLNVSDLQLLPYRKQSVVARASYAYDTRYMIEASVGMTGSENFARNHRWGVFPAVGVAWYVSHEKFMESLNPTLSTFKLRASYGITGNDDIGSNRFPYRGSVNTDAPGYNLGLSPGAGGGETNWVGTGIVEGAIAMPTLTWEKEKKLNAGIDLGLFNGRIQLSADYFYNRREDILLQRRTILDTSGMRNPPYQNYGIMDNRGFDANITLRQNFGDFTLSALGNMTFARNKVVEYDEVPPRYDYQRVTGYQLGKPWLYIADGLYTPDDFIVTTNPDNGAKLYTLKDGYPTPAANVQPGDIKYRDLNNDGVINTYDRTVEHGYYGETPEIVYGFGLNAEWKGFFVGVFFQGAAHASQTLNNYGSIMPFSVSKNASSARSLLADRWSANDPYNQNVLYPRVHSGEFSYNNYDSTWWRRNSDFLRFKNLEVGYEFPKKLLRKINLTNLRIYFQGDNLAVWDNIKYWDPELNQWSTGSTYPLNRTYTIGLNVTI